MIIRGGFFVKVEDALLIGDLSKGVVVAGSKGLSREILSIEVMEVPEVISWISDGILVMTAFYSIRNEPEKQTDVVKTLIDKGAAGIVVKLGRFIEKLPEEMIKIANENAFPIISIPKNISYINVLTPLYEHLYEEKKTKIDQSGNPFNEFEQKEFQAVDQAINYLSEMTGSSVYIEDLEGKLLYHSANFQADKWRSSKMLFSDPLFPLYTKILEKWRIDFQNSAYVNYHIEGHRSRYVIPLVSKNQLFGIIHLIHKGDEALKGASYGHISRVGTIISELLLNEQLMLQKERMKDLEDLEKFNNDEVVMKQEDMAVIVYFYGNTANTSHYPVRSLLDYSCLYRKKLQSFLTEIPGLRTVIFEKYQQYYGLLICDENLNQEMLHILNSIIRDYTLRYPEDYFHMAISHPFRSSDEIEEKVRSVIKTMEIGLKIKPDEPVYSHDKLGIYEILLRLTEDSQAMAYINSVLETVIKSEKTLFETLRVYLEENGNVSKASEKLFIHRRTLTYRLQKIQELLMMDLDNAEHRFILQFCIKLKDLK